MSSALSTAARDDVEIIYDSRPGGAASYLKLGWLLRATCFDAIAHTRLADLADSAVIFGTIMKLIDPPSKSSQDPASGQPIDATTTLETMQWQLTEPRPSQRLWGNVLSSWRSPTKLDPFFAASPQSLGGVDQADRRQLALLAHALRQRVLSCENTQTLLSDDGAFSALGGLHKHGVCFVQHNADSKLAEVYLFERALLLASPDNSTGCQDSEVRSSEIDAVVRIGDITDISHTSVARDGKSCYRLELQVRPAVRVTETWALIFDDESGDLATSWSALLCRFVSQSRRSIGPPYGETPLAMGSFAFGNWYTPTRPIPDFLSLHKYAQVTIHSDDCTADCSAYLFDDVLLFIYKDTDGALHIHKRVNLADISLISDKSDAALCAVAVTILTQPDGNHHVFVSGFDYGQPGHTRVDYTFTVRTKGQVKEWLQALEARVFALRPSPMAAIPPADDSPPPEPSWHIAGVVFLTMSPEGSTNEYNIGVAVLPQFASDQLATHAVARVLKTAFETLRAHRVQARVLCTESAAPAVRKFVHLGLTHEGVRRRAAVHPTTGEDVDVAVLALLDVDWDIRASVRPPTYSMWEEMLDRHQRERDSLLVSHGGLRRTRSMETIRDLRALVDAAPTPSVLGDDAQSTTAFTHASFPSHTVGSWHEVLETASTDLRMHRRYRQDDERAVRADDAADEDSFELWDDMSDDGTDGL